MKIKIITKHAPSNYGSLLQSIATLTVLKRMGHEAQIIDYQRPDERGLENTLNRGIFKCLANFLAYKFSFLSLCI